MMGTLVVKGLIFNTVILIYNLKFSITYCTLLTKTFPELTRLPQCSISIPPENVFGFLTLSGSIEMEHWAIIG